MPDTLVKTTSLAEKLDSALAGFSTTNFSHQQFLMDVVHASKQRLGQLFDDLSSAADAMRRLLDTLPEKGEFDTVMLKVWTPEMREANLPTYHKLCALAAASSVFRDDVAKLIRRINGETRINPIQKFIENPEQAEPVLP